MTILISKFVFFIALFLAFINRKFISLSIRENVRVKSYFTMSSKEPFDSLRVQAKIMPSSKSDEPVI